MNKALPPITDSPEILHKQLRMEHDAKRRHRLQALYLLASGQATARCGLAHLLAVQRHPSRVWLTLYEAGGLQALLRIKHAPGTASPLSPALLSQLRARLDAPRGFARYGAMQQSLAREHHVPRSLPGCPRPSPVQIKSQKGSGSVLAMVSAVLYTSLAVVAVNLLIGSAGGSGSEDTKGWTAWLMSFPFGIWLVGIVGVLITGFGFYQLYRAWTVKLDTELELRQMTRTVRRWTIRFGRFGFAARGVVFCLIGGFFIIAAVQVDPREARGIGEALQALQPHDAGPWLLGLVAFGLIAYGLYQVATAAYRRIRPA